MDVADLQAELRSRTPWEAVDLGFALTRRELGLVYRAWLALVVPLQVGVFVVCWGHPWLAALLSWWLIPVWERVPLFVVSRALFGVRPTVGDAVRGLWATGLSGLLGDLTLRRLAPTRTITLPVTQLERLSGGRARRRRAALCRDMFRTGLGVGVACLCVEGGLLLSALVLVSWVLPDGPAWSLDVLFDKLFDGAWWTAPLVALSTITLLGLVQPLRTGSLFGVYIQRRTALEGWDVELGFRRLAERLRKRAAGAASSVALLSVALLVVLALSLSGGGFARAADPADGDVRAVAEQVLAGDEFGGTRTVTRWQPRWKPSKDPPSRAETVGLSGVSAGLGGGLQILLAVLVGAALVGLLLSFVVRRPATPDPDRRLPAPPDPREGLLALDGSPLPAEPAAAAWQLWLDGQSDRALGLLYRAAVAHLVSLRGLQVDDSATEGECLRIARRSLPARPVAYLARLTRCWQRRAYAHRSVDEAEMRALVEGWPELDAEDT